MHWHTGSQCSNCSAALTWSRGRKSTTNRSAAWSTLAAAPVWSLINRRAQNYSSQLWRTGSRPRAFQRVIDGVLTLPLSAPKGGSKSVFVFLIKFNLNRIKFLPCGKVIVGLQPFPYLTVYRYWRKRNPATYNLVLKCPTPVKRLLYWSMHRAVCLL